jgi:hypothetical protein
MLLKLRSALSSRFTVTYLIQVNTKIVKKKNHWYDSRVRTGNQNKHFNWALVHYVPHIKQENLSMGKKVEEGRA